MIRRFALLLVPLATASCGDGGKPPKTPSPAASGDAAAGAVPSNPGCDLNGKVPFTPEMIKQDNLLDEEIRQLQFYASGAFTLRREFTEQVHDTARHKLVVKDGTTYEEIQVPCLTPGLVATFGPGPSRHIFVTFEANSGGIDFFAYPSRNAGAFSVFPPPEARDASNAVVFEGNRYTVEGDAALLIEREQLASVQNKKRVLSGLKADAPPPPPAK